MSQSVTIQDFSRMCKNHKDCKFCKLSVEWNGMNIACADLLADYPDKASEIIFNWCKEHPVRTRQDELLEVFPNADIKDGVADICVKQIDGRLAPHRCSVYTRCADCKRAYWLEEVDTRE